MHSNSKCYQTWMLKDLEEKNRIVLMILMILMFLHIVTNNSVLKCLKMPHVKIT